MYNLAFNPNFHVPLPENLAAAQTVLASQVFLTDQYLKQTGNGTHDASNINYLIHLARVGSSQHDPDAKTRDARPIPSVPTFQDIASRFSFYPRGKSQMLDAPMSQLAFLLLGWIKFNDIQNPENQDTQALQKSVLTYVGMTGDPSPAGAAAYDAFVLSVLGTLEKPHHVVYKDYAPAPTPKPHRAPISYHSDFWWPKESGDDPWPY